MSILTKDEQKTIDFLIATVLIIAITVISIKYLVEGKSEVYKDEIGNKVEIIQKPNFDITIPEIQSKK